jgi:hypothetical protein
MPARAIEARALHFSLVWCFEKVMLPALLPNGLGLYIVLMCYILKIKDVLLPGFVLFL